MRRRQLTFTLAFALAAAAPGAGRAEEPADDAPPQPERNQEIGPRIGAQLGFGGVSPGGLRVGGVLLYRMTEETWFDGEASFTFGSGDRGCYLGRDPGEPTVCEHGLADGFSATFAAGGRWLLSQRHDGLVPFVRGGVALSMVSFSDDDVLGLALPLWVGAGGRFWVAPRVAVGGEVVFTVGPGWYDRDQGAEPYVGLIVQFGVDFAL